MILIGSEEIECELNSTWSPAPGTCISGHEDVLMIPDLEMTREVDIAALRWMSRYGSVQDVYIILLCFVKNSLNIVTKLVHCCVPRFKASGNAPTIPYYLE